MLKIDKKEETTKHGGGEQCASANPKKLKKVTIIAPPEKLKPQTKDDYQRKPSPQDNSKKKEEKPRLWPSARIPQGGLFHTAKFKYSPETADLIRLLVKESKMSTMMRKKVDYFLRNGEPFQQPKPKIHPSNINPDREAIEILKRARNAKRKSLDAIMASGAYDAPSYRPKPTDRLPSDKSKLILQETMAGCRLPLTTMKVKRRINHAQEEVNYSNDDLITELLVQINERAEWLAEMEELGQGKKYRDEIREQIAERLRHIKSLERKITLRKEGIRYVD